jgi:hypothetical protein
VCFDIALYFVLDSFLWFVLFQVSSLWCNYEFVLLWDFRCNPWCHC